MSLDCRKCNINYLVYNILDIDYQQVLPTEKADEPENITNITTNITMPSPLSIGICASLVIL